MVDKREVTVGVDHGNGTRELGQMDSGGEGDKIVYEGCGSSFYRIGGGSFTEREGCKQACGGECGSGGSR